MVMFDTSGLLQGCLNTQVLISSQFPEAVPVDLRKVFPSLDAHVLLPPGLGQHLHLVGCAADLPLSPHSSIRLPQPDSDSCVEHLLQILLRQCRAFNVRHSPNLLRKRSGVLLHHRPLFPPRQLNQHLDVLPQVTLCAYKEDGCERATAADFGHPLLPDVLKGRRTDHAEAEQQGIGAIVAEVAKFVKLILMETETVSEQCGNTI